MQPLHFKAINFLRTHSYLSILLMFLGLWFSIFLTSGTLFSGFHFTDDHDIVAIYHYLTDQQMGFAQVVVKWLQEDHATGRFRIFYFINRIFQTTFLGIQFPLWATYNGVVAVLTTFFFFIFARLLKFSILQATLFALLTTLGSQSAIWWQLGPAETIATFLLSIALVFTALSATASRFQPICGAFAVLYAVLMSLSKENYILMLPAIAFLKVSLSAQSLGSWIKAIRQDFLVISLLGLAFLAELLFIKYGVGTTPEIGYAGFEGFNLDLIWQSFHSLSIYGDYGIILLGLLLMTILQKSQSNSTGSLFLDAGKAVYPSAVILFIPIALFILVALPQALIYAKSGISQRYIFPGILAYSFWTVSILRELEKNSKRFSKIILLTIAITLSFKLHSSWNTARIFALEGQSTNQLLTAIAEHTKPTDPILLVTNPFIYSEWTFSFKKYMNYVLNRSNLYLSTYEQYDVGNFSKKLRNFYENQTLNSIQDKNDIQCIVVFPMLNNVFLENSSTWFIRQNYREWMFGKFNRHLNPDSKINLYCKE